MLKEKRTKKDIRECIYKIWIWYKNNKWKININSNQFDKSELSLNKDNVVLIQGPSNRVHELLIKFNQNEEDFERYFNYHRKYFQGIFLLYDVDHNSNKDIENLMNKFNDEFTGMLLLSSPCIEVIGDLIEIEKKTNGHIWKNIKKNWIIIINMVLSKK